MNIFQESVRLGLQRFFYFSFVDDGIINLSIISLLLLLLLSLFSKRISSLCKHRNQQDAQ